MPLIESNSVQSDGNGVGPVWNVPSGFSSRGPTTPARGWQSANPTSAASDPGAATVSLFNSST